MPVYQFACRACGKQFDVIETISEHDKHVKAGSDEELVHCPACRSTDVDRRWSSVYAVTSKKS